MKPTPAALGLALAALTTAHTAYSAEPLGRLFLTPERRAVLERQRQLDIQEVQPTAVPTLRLDGVVTRSSGRNTVWVNQQPQHDNATPGLVTAVSAQRPAQATVTAPGERPTTLSVGDVASPATGGKTGILAGGRISVSTPP
jgi:hypothetical protein